MSDVAMPDKPSEMTGAWLSAALALEDAGVAGAAAADTNDGINVLVTGEAAKTIRWVARAEIAALRG